MENILLFIKDFELGTKVSSAIVDYKKNVEFCDENTSPDDFVDRSLLNLKLDKIDLLQLHCPPLEILKKPETFEKMDHLVKKGKILNYGVSVYNLSEAFESLKYDKVKSIQLVFNVFRQKPLDKFFKLAKEKKVAIIARGPLASGLLGGQFNLETK